MTEREAKNKWCPMSLHGEDALVPCCASHCMAWVWDKEYCTSQMDEVDSTTRGHCGLVK